MFFGSAVTRLGADMAPRPQNGRSSCRPHIRDIGLPASSVERRLDDAVEAADALLDLLVGVSGLVLYRLLGRDAVLYPALVCGLSLGLRRIGLKDAVLGVGDAV